MCYVHTVCAASANTWGRLGKECRQDVSISVKVQSAKPTWLDTPDHPAVLIELIQKCWCTVIIVQLRILFILRKRVICKKQGCNNKTEQ